MSTPVQHLPMPFVAVHGDGSASNTSSYPFGCWYRHCVLLKDCKMATNIGMDMFGIDVVFVKRSQK